MIPILLVQISLLIIIFRSAYKLFQFVSRRSKDWLEILFQTAIIIFCLSLLM